MRCVSKIEYEHLIGYDVVVVMDINKYLLPTDTSDIKYERHDLIKTFDSQFISLFDLYMDGF